MNGSENIKLSMMGLPVMTRLEDLSALTHISKHTIFHLSSQSEKYYKTFEIQKKDGRLRTIHQPSRKLKGLQAWILYNILSKLAVSNSSKGFEKKTSIRDNAEPHKDSSVIVSLDIKDFFPTIKSFKIFTVFKTAGYNNLISTVLTNLCTVNDSLPQGGPCSPKLANLASWSLDIRIQGFVGKRGITYTRYADDLTFSGLNPVKLVKIISFIERIVKEEDFELNKNKTRILGLGRAKVVTGLMISDGEIGVGKYKFKQIRAKVHALTKQDEQQNIKQVHQVQGWLAYLNSVDKKRYNKIIPFIRKLKELYPLTLISKLYIPPLIIEIKTTTEVRIVP